MGLHHWQLASSSFLSIACQLIMPILQERRPRVKGDNVCHITFTQQIWSDAFLGLPRLPLKFIACFISQLFWLMEDVMCWPEIFQLEKGPWNPEGSSIRKAHRIVWGNLPELHQKFRVCQCTPHESIWGTLTQTRAFIWFWALLYCKSPSSSAWN